MPTTAQTPTPADIAPKTDDEPTNGGAATPPPSTPPRLPDDHPLVTAYARQKAENEDLKEKARRLDEIEEAAKTEAQKQAEETERLRAENAAYKQREQVAAWADEIAKDSHVPASVLRGSTREELQVHHDSLASLIPKPSTDPAPQPGVTTTGQTPPPPGNVTISEQIAAAEAAGDKSLVMTLKAMQLGNVKP